MITSRIVADSLNPMGQRITSWLLTYPRFIHSEFMTHRVFSRNAASSRAIPLLKMVGAVKAQMATPELWAKNQSGMEGNVPHEDPAWCRGRWKLARDLAVTMAVQFGEREVHKAIANRLLEPFSHITVLATATDVEHFFNLRCHPAAQPEFQVLAFRMLKGYLDSKPMPRAWGEWHLPGIDEDERTSYPLADLLKIATAKAARTSYNRFDEALTRDKAHELHDKLATAGHWSPFEHCAMAQPKQEDLNALANARIRERNSQAGCTIEEEVGPAWTTHDQGNFNGWRQYRKLFSGENSPQVDLAKVLARKPEWLEL